jgi:predicted small lipoprotein YifL
LPLFFASRDFLIGGVMMRFSFFILASVIFSVAAVSGCGQTGALYLPEDATPKPPVVAPAAAPEKSPAPVSTLEQKK